MVVGGLEAAEAIAVAAASNRPAARPRKAASHQHFLLASHLESSYRTNAGNQPEGYLTWEETLCLHARAFQCADGAAAALARYFGYESDPFSFGKAATSQRSDSLSPLSVRSFSCLAVSKAANMGVRALAAHVHVAVHGSVASSDRYALHGICILIPGPAPEAGLAQNRTQAPSLHDGPQRRHVVLWLSFSPRAAPTPSAMLPIQWLRAAAANPARWDLAPGNAIQWHRQAWSHLPTRAHAVV